MEIYKSGTYWRIKNSRGPIPKALQGMYTSYEFAENAVKMFQAGVRSRAIDTVARRQNYKKDVKETDAPSNSAYAS